MRAKEGQGTFSRPESGGRISVHRKFSALPLRSQLAAATAMTLRDSSRFRRVPFSKSPSDTTHLVGYVSQAKHNTTPIA